jgi:hypothetical protein
VIATDARNLYFHTVTILIIIIIIIILPSTSNTRNQILNPTTSLAWSCRSQPCYVAGLIRLVRFPRNFGISVGKLPTAKSGLICHRSTPFVRLAPTLSTRNPLPLQESVQIHNRRSPTPSSPLNLLLFSIGCHQLLDSQPCVKSKLQSHRRFDFERSHTRRWLLRKVLWLTLEQQHFKHLHVVNFSHDAFSCPHHKWHSCHHQWLQQPP